jgi:hypothetical protein
MRRGGGELGNVCRLDTDEGEVERNKQRKERQEGRQRHEWINEEPVPGKRKEGTEEIKKLQRKAGRVKEREGGRQGCSNSHDNCDKRHSVVA